MLALSKDRDDPEGICIISITKLYLKVNRNQQYNDIIQKFNTLSELEKE